MIEAYPLSWPVGWKRTDPRHRGFGRFRTSSAAARDELLHELELLGAGAVILSTNVPLKRDGTPYANQAAPEDPGVAVYFTYNKKQMCFACDRYSLVKDNMQAVRLTINAIRGIERWGASDMLERAFAGFTALPERGTQAWREVLGFKPTDVFSAEHIEARFRALAKQLHPDVPGTGDAVKMRELLEAREAARLEYGAPEFQTEEVRA